MTKKNFKDNPACRFFSTSEPEPQPAGAPPDGYKRNPLFVETKSRRLQLVLQPSLYERVKACAIASGLSVNEYVHKILESATRGE